MEVKLSLYFVMVVENSHHLYNGEIPKIKIDPFVLYKSTKRSM